MLGVTVGFMVYLGGPMVLLDRFLLIRYQAALPETERQLFASAVEHNRA
jgi:hypothetical protein